MATIGELLGFLPHPQCARCGCLVEQFDSHDDRVVPGLVLRARCHGATEFAWLTDAEVAALRPGSLQVLQAFRPGSRLAFDPRDFAFREPRPYASGEVPRYDPRAFSIPISSYRVSPRFWKP